MPLVLRSLSEHLNYRNGSLFTFVAKFSTRTLEGLLFVQRGEDPKSYGLSGGQVYFHDALGYRLAYIIKVRSISLDHTTKANHGVNILVFGEPLGRERQLKASRNILDRKSVV